MTTEPVIEIRGLCKRFGSTSALDGVDLTVTAGSVHALIGLNGSGKSTLVKVLSGFYSADEGEIACSGMAFVHQDLGLAPPLSVLENFVMGRPVKVRLGSIDWGVERARAVEALSEFGLQHTLDRQLGTLSQAQRAILALARALDRARGGDTTALILDEPTSALPSHEIAQLAAAVERCAARGMGIVFITHRLSEVKSLCDRVTVLRNGRVVRSSDVEDLSVADMVDLMVGDTPTRGESDWQPTLVDGTPVLEATGLTAETLAGVDLTVRGGEIVGIFGMVGSGIEELGPIISGRHASSAGRINLCGSPLHAGIAASRQIGYVPSDRPRRGVFPGLSVKENMLLPVVRKTVRRGRISRRVESDLTTHWVEALRVKPANVDAPILSLSGGNQQKVVLGRWLAVAPKLIVAEEPTQGVDVWAKAEILHQLRTAADAGTAVVLTAVEPEEILDYCTRVTVVRAGRIALDRAREEISIKDLLTAMH